MLIADAGDAGCGRLNDGDVERVADGVTGYDAILQVLPDAAIGFSGEDCCEPLPILPGLHFERLIHKPAVGC